MKMGENIKHPMSLLQPFAPPFSVGSALELSSVVEARLLTAVGGYGPTHPLDPVAAEFWPGSVHTCARGSTHSDSKSLLSTPISPSMTGIASDLKYTLYTEVVTGWPPKLVLIVDTYVVTSKAKSDIVASGVNELGTLIPIISV